MTPGPSPGGITAATTIAAVTGTGITEAVAGAMQEVEAVGGVMAQVEATVGVTPEVLATRVVTVEDTAAGTDATRRLARHTR